MTARGSRTGPSTRPCGIGSAAEGRFVPGTVAVTSAPHELLDVAHGRIAVLRRGEFDEEFIEVYEVELPR
ncbi:hypothetical protein [Candidatus Palauibacter sp.]|uniref:hypothetical protein n=1 Tax=Candidatus Palauibacter sp. TaxID=3101350 RepID=UPI003C6FB81E